MRSKHFLLNLNKSISTLYLPKKKGIVSSRKKERKGKKNKNLNNLKKLKKKLKLLSLLIHHLQLL